MVYVGNRTNALASTLTTTFSAFSLLVYYLASEAMHILLQKKGVSTIQPQKEAILS